VAGVWFGSENPRLRTARLAYLALATRLRVPQILMILRYSFVGQRPSGKLVPMHPDQVRKSHAQMASVAQLLADISNNGAL